jgi:hypothetical protein
MGKSKKKKVDYAGLCERLIVLEQKVDALHTQEILRSGGFEAFMEEQEFKGTPDLEEGEKQDG